MLPVRTGYHDVWLFGEDSAYTTGRWALGCSETVMANMYVKSSIPWKRKNIVLGRWIDADEHMYI